VIGGGGNGSDREVTVDDTGGEFGGYTQTHGVQPEGPKDVAVRSFRLTVVEGPGAGTIWESRSDRCSIGSAPLNDLVIEDPTVSRFHCEVKIEPQGAAIYDLNSRNGTVVDGVQVREAFLRGGTLIRLGRATIRFQFGTESNTVPLSDKTQLGKMVGRSIAMRSTFALLERAARTDATILLEGETGTGKGTAADAIHRHSKRKDGPLVVVDCGAIPGNLLESELFGHERGAFTGADKQRIGAFEEADGGTIFLDEIGELPSDLQPKLLRVLESREFRRVGQNTFRPVDARVIAATNRDLREEVNAGRFRSDLYFRLAVVKIPLPPLRERPDDIPQLVEQILGSLGADPTEVARLTTKEFITLLQHAAWPGNVRELRNHLERCLVFQDASPVGESVGGANVSTGGTRKSASERRVDASMPYAEARVAALSSFEKGYLSDLMQRHNGKVVQAAGAAGIDRVYLYRLLKKHGLGR
jgi:two-component system, NtrC family, response regulator GlrR